MYFCHFVNSISTSVSSVFFPAAAAAGILRGPGGANVRPAGKCPPCFPPQPSPVLSPPAGDQPLLPQILHHHQGVDGRCDQEAEWEVLGDGSRVGLPLSHPPRPLLVVVLPRAVHAAVQPKQSPTCLRTSRRGHELQPLCQSAEDSAASPVDVQGGDLETSERGLGACCHVEDRLQ